MKATHTKSSLREEISQPLHYRSRFDSSKTSVPEVERRAPEIGPPGEVKVVETVPFELPPVEASSFPLPVVVGGPLERTRGGGTAPVVPSILKRRDPELSVPGPEEGAALTVSAVAFPEAQIRL